MSWPSEVVALKVSFSNAEIWGVEEVIASL
jgi:hypothetical protein